MSRGPSLAGPTLAALLVVAAGAHDAGAQALRTPASRAPDAASTTTPESALSAAVPGAAPQATPGAANPAAPGVVANPAAPGVANPAAPNAANPAAPGTPPAEDIRDIRGPRAITPVWLWPAIIAAGVLLLLGLVALWRRLRRRRERPLLPFEVALQRLESIRTLMRPESVRDFSSAVSDIVRSYIEQRFQVTAARRTTEEFLHDLLSTAELTLARHRGLLADFLEQCDLAKFAEVSLSLQTMESLHRSARTFVLETAKPDPPAPSPAAAPRSATTTRASLGAAASSTAATTPAPFPATAATTPAAPRTAPSAPPASSAAPAAAAPATARGRPVP